MSTTMNALNSANIRHAEFVRMVVGKTSPTTYTFCNAAAPITVSGITFSGMGSLLGIGQVERNIKSTSTDMMVSLTGINPANVALILSADIKGSTVEIWRGFLDTNNQIITTPTQQFFKRYQGIITNVSITEDWNDDVRSRIATCSISCTSMKRVLETYVASSKTNKAIWQDRYGTSETSMDRVDAISSTYFDFGKPASGGGVASPGGINGGNGGTTVPRIEYDETIQP
jgi:hypothetical protein